MENLQNILKSSQIMQNSMYGTVLLPKYYKIKVDQIGYNVNHFLPP